MQLRDYQKESHDRVWEEWERVDKTLLVLPTGCHALGERLLMANGEIKAVEDIEVSDQLMGPDGTSRTVLYRQEGTDTLYRITPVKGDPFIVTGDHKLSLVRTKEKSRNLYPSDRLAGQIVDVTVEDWLKWSKWKKHIHKLFRAEKIENFKGPSKDLTIDPYFLGVILGDACLQYEISITTMDSVIVEEIEKQCMKYGLKYRTEPAGKALSYYLSADKSKEKRNRLLDDLADLKLRGYDSYTKFVPFNYKTSSLRDRLELIAGLIDSDGSNNNNGFDFISASKQLAEDLAFMCRSVGLAAYVKECQKSCKSFTGTYFRVSISGNTDIVPCRVAHKKARERLQVKNVLRTGFKVEKLEAGSYVGFTVDKDNRYLLDDFTVTHNCGKTIVFSKIIETAVKQGKRVLILAHRDELLEQARDKLERVSGLKCSIEKADESCLDSFYRVTTGSIQTLAREKRLNKFSKDHWDIIVVDEAHHVLSESYKRVIDYFDTAKLLGVTATPDRGDLRNLGEVFESLAYEYKLSKAIKDGYLVPIKAMTIPLEIDLTKVKQQTGDFSNKELGTVLDPYLDAIADEMVKVAKDRKTVVFLPLIETSKKFVRILNSKGFNATEVNGESKDRDKKLRDFDSGKYDVLCNSMLLCLDMDTEILTDKGFVKHSEMTYKHKVANWAFDGSVYFEEPKEIIKRPLGIDEHMVKIESKTINFNVTHTHKMIVGAGEKNKNWKKISAENLRSGHVLPASGIAEPFDLTIEQPDYKPITKREVNSRSYHIRQSTEMNIEDSKVEALKRAKDKRKNLYTQPKDLSIDDCKFIGFWIADGSKNKLQSGGIEYTAVQGTVYPYIIEWFRNVIKNINVDFIERKKENKIKKHFTEYITWSFPRGTGSGSQKRNGLFRLEPYLKKEGTNLFWALNEEQFDALVEGYWYGDGHHGQAESGMPNSIFMSDTNEEWIDLLCTIGCVRGWRCRKTFIASKSKKHKDQHGLRMIKNGKLNISNKTVIEKHSNVDEVWCVRTTTKNIITRRHGIVTVTGNTEGWDCPSVDCVIVLRPTKVRALYAQMVGRGLRLAPNKDDLLVLDFLWHSEKHRLIHPANLVAQNEQVADKMTEILVGKDDYEVMELEELLEEAESSVIEEREEALADELKEMKKRKRKLVDPLQFEMSIKAEDLANYVPAFGWEMGPPTEKQIKVLEQNGIYPDEIENAGKASLILDRLNARKLEGLATPKQIRFLEKRGFNHVGQWKFDSANSMISRIEANNWRNPRGVTPSTYKPDELTK